MAKEINVTREDIQKGRRGVCSSCPIALALRRAFSTDKVDVDSFFLTIGFSAYMTPLIAVEFMAAFDRGEAVEPISFSL